MKVISYFKEQSHILQHRYKIIDLFGKLTIE